MLTKMSVISTCFLVFAGYLPGGAGQESARFNSFISPRVSINTLILQQAIDEPLPGQATRTDAATPSLQAELAARQPLALAYKLLEKEPLEAARFLLDDIPDKQKWLVLKKLPPQVIAAVLDTMETGTAGRIIQLMRPLKAGLTLNAMHSGEKVFSALPTDRRQLLLSTPGPRHIAHATIEEADYFRAGGLGDVLKNLPRETAEQGDEPTVVMPLWKGIDKSALKFEKTVRIPMDAASGGQWQEEVDILSVEVGEIIKYKILFLKNNNFFNVNQSKIYAGRVDERFVLLAKAVLEAMRTVSSKPPDIIQCHEWQTGLIPVYLKAFYRELGIDYYRRTKTIYTSHNPALDKKYPGDMFYVTGLDPQRFFRSDALKVNDEWSFTKAGLLYADFTNIVGKSIVEDVQKFDYVGLKDVYKQLAKEGKLFGIINGGNEHFRAEVNKKIAVKFDAAHLDRRSENTEALQRNLGLEINPDKLIIATIGRIADQKGYDIIEPLIIDLLEQGFQFVSLGEPHPSDPSGLEQKRRLEELLHIIRTEPRYEKYRDQVSLNFMFGRDFSDGTSVEALVSSGAHIGLLPQIFEPCGLVQMNIAGCGGVPVAMKQLGLADTITPFDPQTGEGMGFLFEEHTSQALNGALTKAINIWRNNPQAWRRIQENNMNADFSWDPVFWQYRDLMYSHAWHTPPVLNSGLFDTSPRAQKMSQAPDGTDIVGQSI